MKIITFFFWTQTTVRLNNCIPTCVLFFHLSQSHCLKTWRWTRTCLSRTSNWSEERWIHLGTRPTPVSVFNIHAVLLENAFFFFNLLSASIINERRCYSRRNDYFRVFSITAPAELSSLSLSFYFFLFTFFSQTSLVRLPSD